MNLQQLYYFQAIVKEGSYTKAAEKLRITQSSLSHSMANLEQELKLELFEKQGHQIRPTPFGRQFLDHADRAIKEVEAIREEAEAAVNPRRGRIRLSVAHTMTFGFLPNMLRYFRQIPENEEIQFDFVEMESSLEAMKQIEEGNIDLAFGAKILKPGFRFFEVMREELIAIVIKNHPLAKRENVSLRELLAYPLVTYSYSCGTRLIIDQILLNHGVTPPAIKEVKNEKMIASIVSAGLGVGIIPRQPELDLYDISAVTLENHALRRSLYMMWNINQPMPTAVKNFRDFILDVLKTED